MPAITFAQAACCLVNAVHESAVDAGAPPFQHRYLSVASTWPYCPHDSVVANWKGQTTIGPPGTRFAEDDDARGGDRVWYDQFELHVIRCGPAVPEDSAECLAGLYGDCATAAPNTLTGHHNLVTAEAERLTGELLDRWCDCLVSTDGLYSRAWPRWISTPPEIRTQGRFSAIVLGLSAQIR